MPQANASSDRFPAACLAVLAVCGAGFSVLQSELAARAVNEPEWVRTCTRVGMGAFLTGAWVSVLFTGRRRTHTALAALLLGGICACIPGGPNFPAGVALFAAAVGFAEVTLARELARSGNQRPARAIMLAHAGWPLGVLFGILLRTGLSESPLSPSLAFLALHAVGALWMARWTWPPDHAASGPRDEPDAGRLPSPLLIPIALLVGAIEFSGEARLLARVPAGWDTRAFVLLMITLASARLGHALLLAKRPHWLHPVIAAALVTSLLPQFFLTGDASAAPFLATLFLFGLGKAMLWPGLLALGVRSAPRHVRFILPALISLGVLAPGLLSLMPTFP